MSTEVQMEIGSVLEALGFEFVPSDVCGGDQTYIATDKTRSLLEPVLSDGRKLLLTGGGELIAG